jgi:hypothetical protein
LGKFERHSSNAADNSQWTCAGRVRLAELGETSAPNGQVEKTLAVFQAVQWTRSKPSAPLDGDRNQWPSKMTQFLSLPYHQPAFIHLSKIFEDEIHYALTRKFAEWRGKQFLERFTPNEVIESKVAWELARDILDCIDNEMRTLKA